MFTREDFPVEKLGKFVKIVLHYMCEPRSPGELSISGRFTEIATYKVYIDPGLHIVGDWVYFTEMKGVKWSMYTNKDFPIEKLARLVTIVKNNEVVVRGFFMQCKVDKVYISIPNLTAHEYVNFIDMKNVIWE